VHNLSDFFATRELKSFLVSQGVHKAIEIRANGIQKSWIVRQVADYMKVLPCPNKDKKTSHHRAIVRQLTCLNNHLIFNTGKRKRNRKRKRKRRERGGRPDHRYE
jgi:hypothetical protein